jgi:hypothetical protein
MAEPLPPHPLHETRRAPRASEAEVLALVERASAFADGLALLEGAPLECVAVLLGVSPRTVERVRAALEDPALRAAAARLHGRGAAGSLPRAAATPAAPPRPRDAQALLVAALARDGGVALLLSAAPEAAAVAFGVHPDLVHDARHAAGASPRPDGR